MDIEIKPMKTDDAQEVKMLSGQLGYPLSTEEITSGIKEILSTNDNCAYVAIVNEKIVGWIHAFRAVRIESLPFTEIGGLVVDENYRSKSIGRKLVERIKEWSLQKGVPDIRVRSHIKRKDAHRFYLALGFEQTKEQKVFQMNL